MTLNVWEAVYFDHDLDRLVDLAERAAKLGVERYVLDHGWFGTRRNDRAGLGDWTVSKEVWPDGLHPLVNTVTGLGMQFGLWFEPEMINLDSDAARAHPEWVMATGDRLPIESRHQQVINLGIPECYAYTSATRSSRSSLSSIQSETHTRSVRSSTPRSTRAPPEEQDSISRPGCAALISSSSR